MTRIQTVQHLVPNGDGWRLAVSQTWDADRFDSTLRPVLIVPGYGMSSYIYSYHPSGLSLEGFLAEAGLEVWRADLRAQGGSVCDGGSDNFRLEDLAVADLGAAVSAVLEKTRTRVDRVDVLGGSLGGTLMFAHAALRPNHRFATLVCMGTPVRWVKIHPLLRLAFASPTIAGMVRFRGTRRIAEVAFPLLARYTPWLLSIYINPEITDVSAAREMTRTVEDPNRHINRQIAHWIRQRDLIVNGVNVSEALRRVTHPLLCVLAVGDGVVPPATAAFPFYQIGSTTKRLVEVGTRTVSMAHADMFVSNQAHERVFRPIREWLLEQQQPRAPEASARRVE